jgi:hypothetical protein
MDDAWALIRADRHSAADYLTLAAGFGRESSSGVLAEVVDRLGFIHEYLTADASRRRFEEFIRTMLRPLARQVGFASSPSDTDERRALRAVVIGTLGTIGGDQDVVRDSRAALDAVLDGRSGVAIDSTLKESVVEIAATHGDDKLYEALASATVRAASPEERSLYLFAAASFRDRALVERGLRRALSGDLRTQDTARYLSAFFDNPDARPYAWAFLKTNWTELEPKLRVFNAGAAITRSLGMFCDSATRDDIRSFLGGKKMPGLPAALNQTIERINNCIDLRQKQMKPVAEWVAAQ